MCPAAPEKLRTQNTIAFGKGRRFFDRSAVFCLQPCPNRIYLCLPPCHPFFVVIFFSEFCQNACRVLYLQIHLFSFLFLHLLLYYFHSRLYFWPYIFRLSHHQSYFHCIYTNYHAPIRLVFSHIDCFTFKGLDIRDDDRRTPFTMSTLVVTYYPYFQPSAAAAGVFCGLFGLGFLVSTYQSIRYKAWIWFVMLLAILSKSLLLV